MPDPKGLVQSNPANDSKGKHIHSFSTFDKSLSYRHYNTLRFGEYTPTFLMEGVPTDEISLNSKDVIDSLSLNAPFKGQIRKVKESFAVPNMAILPRNWDRIYAQPSNGQDIPVDANCVLQNFPSNFSTLWTNAYNLVVDNAATTTTITNWLTALVRCLVLGEYVYSAGSLLNVCGYKGSAQFRYIANGATEFYTYDQWFDLVISKVFSTVDSLEVFVPDGGAGRHLFCKGLNDIPSDYHYNLPFRAVLETFRENPTAYFMIANVDQTSYDAIFSDITGSHSLFLKSAIGKGPQFILPTANPADADDFTECSQTNLNLSRVLAYQLVCFHFYTNSSIDYIYSAELYRQYINSLMYTRGWTKEQFQNFQNNGYRLPYDTLSGRLLDLLLIRFNSTGPTQILTWSSFAAFSGPVATYGQVLTCLSAWAAIFAFRRSLRYGDYFVGSRPRPLAPINTDVSVNNNAVSVVDVTRSIQAQRFANAVMRSRSKIEEYVKSLFGKALAPDYHNPFFLTRQEEYVFGDDVQNTGDSQITDPNSRTANFASAVGQFTFTFHNDDSHPCIYLQIVSFDVRRAYTRSVDRQFLHLDRFDMFNPDFQYIGDQPVYGVELGYSYNGSMPAIFAYQSRDMEYKERFDVASGGFVDNLPGWILTDNFRSFDDVQNIDSDFIRSYNSEIDRFFVSLTGFSLGSYFHFIFCTTNNVSARRPMAVDPQILA